jgi:hypothetical protein
VKLPGVDQFFVLEEGKGVVTNVAVAPLKAKAAGKAGK